MGKLAGKAAVVTSGSKGIGAAIAKALADEGAAVAVNYSSGKAGADQVVRAITMAGGKAVAVGGDVTQRADAQAIVDTAIEHFGRLAFRTLPDAMMTISPGVLGVDWDRRPCRRRLAGGHSAHQPVQPMIEAGCPCRYAPTLNTEASGG
jgi:NAD(P)-dependent dehydrogenase (short-subunit alcohol dehydrogenase family)